jgi:hypothetical protein
MTYTKPKLTGYSAVAVVQSGNQTKAVSPLEPHSSINSAPAYEADE